MPSAVERPSHSYCNLLLWTNKMGTSHLCESGDFGKLQLIESKKQIVGGAEDESEFPTTIQNIFTLVLHLRPIDDGENILLLIPCPLPMIHELSSLLSATSKRCLCRGAACMSSKSKDVYLSFDTFRLRQKRWKNLFLSELSLLSSVKGLNEEGGAMMSGNFESLRNGELIRNSRSSPKMTQTTRSRDKTFPAGVNRNT